MSHCAASYLLIWKKVRLVGFNFVALAFLCAAQPASTQSPPLEPSRPRGLPPQPRKVEKDEITAFRDKTEDDLRIKVLSVYGEQEQIAKLQKIFNGLWDKDGIEYLWAEAIKADDYQAEPILALLVYLRTKHDGCEIGELLKLKFDWLYAHIREFREGTSKKFGHYPAHDNLSGVILRALAAYGSAKLLTPGFWSLLGTYQVGGQTTLRCLQRMVDERTLQDLKEFEKTCPWTNKRELLDLIAEIESRLNAAKKQNETSKP